jgi:hypothetical protein
MSAAGKEPVILPVLRDADEIREYFLNQPINDLQKNEIKEELDHWQRLLVGRWQVEIEKIDNPGFWTIFCFGRVP